MIGSDAWTRLQERMTRLGMRETDLEERFVRSSGRGGQNVNKVSSCVWLHHPPSGLQVKCQVARTQGENRYFARKLLCEKLEEKILGAQSARAREVHRIRAQKRKRRKRAKEKMLREKRLTSQKKELRRSPGFEP